IVIGRAQEPVALGQDLENSLGEDQTALLGLRLENLEDELLLPEAARALQIQLLSHAQELGNGLALEFHDVHRVQLLTGWGPSRRAWARHVHEPGHPVGFASLWMRDSGVGRLREAR